MASARWARNERLISFLKGQGFSPWPFSFSLKLLTFGLFTNLSIMAPRIGFDAKRAFLNTTGLGNYSRSLLRSLHEAAPDWELHLFSPKPHVRLQDLLAQEGVQAHFPQKWWWKKLHSLWRSRAMLKSIRRAQLDVYHGLSHELPLGIEKLGIPTVLTMHDLIFMRHPEWYPRLDRFFAERKYRRSCQVAHQVVAISEQTKADIVHYFGITPERIEVIYQSCNPIFYQKVGEEEKTALREKYQLPQDFMLYVGSLTPRKNVLALLQAQKQLREEGLEVPLVLVGRGKAYKDQLAAYIAEEKLPTQLFSEVATPELPGFYQLTQVFVYPSIFEGFGIPILEALHSGTPVISSQGSCFQEAGGPKSLYTPAGEVAALAEAIRSVVEDSRRREAMRQAGLLHAQQFLPNVLAEQWKHLYTSLMRG